MKELRTIPAPLRALAANLLVLAGFVACAKTGLLFSFIRDNVTPLWIPSAVSFSMLLLLGPRCLPGIAAGAFVTTLSTGAPWTFAACTLLGNTLEPLLAWGLTRKFLAPRATHPGSLPQLGAFLLPILLAPLASAAPGALGLLAVGFIKAADLPMALVLWYVGNLAGLYSAAMVWLALKDRQRGDPWRLSLRRPGAWVVLSITLGLFALLYAGLLGPHDSLPLAFLLLPLTVWVCLQGSSLPAQLLALASAGLGMVSTAGGGGPFQLGEALPSMYYLYGFHWVMMANAAFMSVLVQQKEAKAREAALGDLALRESNHRIKNHLNMAVALVQLAADKADPQAKTIAAETENRLLAIAQLHDRLSHAPLGGELSLAQYLGSLAKSVQAIAGRPEIALSWDLDAPRLDADSQLALGLLLQEALSNAFKYAFEPGQADCAIQVALRRLPADQAEFLVEDNGRAKRPADSTAESPRSLPLGGLLVRELAAQLRGTAQMGPLPGGGYRVTLRFPLPAQAWDQEAPSR